MRVHELLTESFESPFPYRANWEEETDDDEDSPYYQQEIPHGLQTVRFTTDDGITYLWYARSSNYDDHFWEIAFGVDSGRVSHRGDTMIDIKRTGTGNQMRVFATIMAITTDFVEYFDDYVHQIYFTADTEDGNRARLYKRMAEKYFDNFNITNIDKDGEVYRFTLTRQY